MSWASYWAVSVYLCTIHFACGWDFPGGLGHRHGAFQSVLHLASARQARKLQRAAHLEPGQPPASAPHGWFHRPTGNTAHRTIQHNTAQHNNAHCSPPALISIFRKHLKCGANPKSGTSRKISETHANFVNAKGGAPFAGSSFAMPVRFPQLQFHPRLKKPLLNSS